MAVSMSELEFEGESEFENEGEWESELEGEFESEQFFQRLIALARQAAGSPALRRVARAGAQAALRGGLSVPGGGASSREMEEEFEWETESELSPLRRVYPDALMEHLGHAAAEAESEAEAEAFIGALVPLAARLMPRVAPAILRVAPRLIRGATRVARTLRRNPGTRPLVRTLPTIVRRTAASMSRQIAEGQPVTAQSAARTLARQTAQVLSSPHQCAMAWRRSRALDRRYHRSAAAAAPRPVRRV